jgi:hypothetical protein
MENVNCPAVDRAIIHAHLAMVARDIESPGWEVWAFNWVTGIDRSKLHPDNAPEITRCANVDERKGLDVWCAARDAMSSAEMACNGETEKARRMAAASIGNSAASMANAPESYAERNRAFQIAYAEELLMQAGEVPDGQ